VWAIGLATAASRTTNPVLLGLVLAVTGFVVASRRSHDPWARAYGVFLKLALAVIVIRVVFASLFGAPVPGRVLLALPEVELPDWAAGVRLGGDVTAEGLAAAVYHGLQLATMLACVGAANALANPRRLLRSMPGALYEVGVAVVVALSFSPQLVEGMSRVRAARRLRGRPHTGLRGLRGVAMPVLESALERSVDLAAAMDSRGFGRAPRHLVHPHLAGGLTLAGLLGISAGLYGLLDAQSPATLGLPLLGAGALVAAVGLAVGGRRAGRTRYRPDRWGSTEWLVSGCGVAAALAAVLAGLAWPGQLHPSTVPLEIPRLPLLPAAGLLLAAIPAWLAPPPAPSTPQPTTDRRAAGGPDRGRREVTA
jgi:energy-coupling factor transport system permease protein